MIWLSVVCSITVIAALASLWGASDDRRDLKSGTPSLESLVSHTGIWNREVFNSLLGEPDSHGRYKLAHNKIDDLPRSLWARYFDNIAIDVSCIILSVAAPVAWQYHWTFGMSLSAIAATAQSVGYAVASVVTYRSGVWKEWVRDAPSSIEKE